MALTDAQFIAWLKSNDAARCALVEVTARIAGVETTLYLSNRNYVTGSADTPASTVYQACIAGGVTFQESLSLDGSASISYGDIEIDNRDGSRDGWLDYVWANRQIRVFMGDVRWPRDDFRKVFDGVVGDLASRARDTLNLRLLDKLQRLNVPVSETLLGGSTQNKDRLIPLTFGECHNVEPLLTNPSTLTFQYHGGASEGLIEVRDNGAVITTWTQSVAAGTFTLTASPRGQITASVQGDKPSGTYNNTIAAIVQRICTAYGPASTRLSTGDLDTAQLATFAAAHTQPVGVHLAARENVLDVCQRLAASVGAQVVMTTAGLLRLVKLSLPASGTPWAITAADIEQRSLRIEQRPPVRSAVKLGYCRNWTVQNTGLALGLPAANAASFGTEWLALTSSDSSVASVYKLDAQPVQEDTLLLREADATTEAARRRDLWKTPRHVYAMRCLPHLLLAELGDAATLTHSRFGLSAGRTGQIVRIGRDWLAGRIDIGVLA